MVRLTHRANGRVRRASEVSIAPSRHKANQVVKKKFFLIASNFEPFKPKDKASVEERDSRTVLAMQLSQRTRERDLKDFFSTVGDVKAVKLIQDGLSNIPYCFFIIKIRVNIVDGP